MSVTPLATLGLQATAGVSSADLSSASLPADGRNLCHWVNQILPVLALLLSFG